MENTTWCALWDFPTSPLPRCDENSSSLARVLNAARTEFKAHTQTHVHRHVCWLQAGCPSSSPSQNFNYIIETITLLCQKVPPLHVDLEWSIPLSRILNLFLPHLPLGQRLSCRHLIAAESFGEMFWNSKLYWTGLKTFQDFALRWEPKSLLTLVACWNESPRLYSISSYSLNEMSPILA